MPTKEAAADQRAADPRRVNSYSKALAGPFEELSEALDQLVPNADMPEEATRIWDAIRHLESAIKMADIIHADEQHRSAGSLRDRLLGPLK